MAELSQAACRARGSAGNPRACPAKPWLHFCCLTSTSAPSLRLTAAIPQTTATSAALVAIEITGGTGNSQGIHRPWERAVLWAGSPRPLGMAQVPETLVMSMRRQFLVVLAVGSCEDCIDVWERKERAHSRETDFFQLLPSTSTGLQRTGPSEEQSMAGRRCMAGSTVHGVFSRDQETPKEQPCSAQS